MKYLIPASIIVAAFLAFALSGCGSSSIESTGSDTYAASGDHDHGEHAKHGERGQTDMEKMKAELAKLSPEDAASAEKQHICPVTGEMIGSTGPPKKVKVNGQQVWICCDDCRDKLLADPDDYLARLKKD